jgi:hypothetical protein
LKKVLFLEPNVIATRCNRAAAGVSYNFGNTKPKKTDLKKKDNSSDMDLEDMEQ